MRAIRYHGREDVRLDDIPTPTAGPGEIRLQVAYNGLCGSDVHEYFNGPAAITAKPHPLTGTSIPCVLGHEFSGWVESLGEGVTGFELGTLVAVQPVETCGSCARCRTGHEHLCRKAAFHGYNRPGGGLSDLTVVRADMVHPVPDSVNAMRAALIEPLAVAHRAVRRASVAAGDLVVVHGAGPIGLGVLMALRQRSAATVVVDPAPERRAAAAALGADMVIDPLVDDPASAVRELTHGEGAAASIDAAGVESALTSALRSTRPDGQVVVVAHHHHPYPLRSGHLIFGEVRLTGSLIYDKDDFADVIAAMADGTYPTEGWTEVISMEAVENGLRSLRDRSSNKLLVRVGA